MIWYNLEFKDGEYRVYRNTEIGRGIGFNKIFAGSRKDCIEYCEKNNIKLGKKNKKVIS